MGNIDERFLAQLKDIVGQDRVRADQRERRMYSFDIGVMPPLVKPFVAAGLAGAVVRPRTENELVEIVNCARAARVPLVARGAASSGYGGVLPAQGGLVIDLSGWQDVLEVDETGLTVRTQAGAIWEEVARGIQRKGLDLRLHPSSYPSSTVAGWLAQGGSGFGSYEYGTFKENVISARVVRPDGIIQTFEGEELQTLVADAEGITGVITEVTFRVRSLEETYVKLISFSELGRLGDFIKGVDEGHIPLWSLTFLNPTSVELKKQLPSRACHAFEETEVAGEATEDAALPVAYLALIAYPPSRASDISPALGALSERNGGVFLSDEAAEHEWAGRSASMRLKRLGPSIIPTEVIVPTGEVASVLAEIADKIDQPFVLEGTVGADGNTVLLGYIPHDERQFGFNLAFALSLFVIKIARAHGGSAYSTGLYFRREAVNLLGAQKVNALAAYKTNYDPDHVMNPGKVFARSGDKGAALDRLMGMAASMEGVIRPIANKATRKETGIPAERHGVPGDVALAALSCARCGYCVHTCEQYSGRGWESQSPRAKYALIADIWAGRARWDRDATYTMLSCTTCERCDLRCQLQLPVEQSGMALRGKLIEEQGMGTFPPFEMMAASLRGEGDIWAGRRIHRADWVPADVAEKIPEKSDVLYFAGCTASYVETDIAESTLRLLQDSGLSVAYAGTEESCCGIPMKMAGHWDLFEKMYEQNVAAARVHGASTIITSCPACALVWKEFYAEEAAKRGEPYEFEVKHYSEVIAPALADGTLKLSKNVFEGHTVTFHDSCHAGRAQGIYEPPREMLKAIPGIEYVEMEHNREEGICCGSVITLVGELPIAPILGGERLKEATEAGADTVIALCPCCQVQLRDSARKNGLAIETDDLARVVATAAGYDIARSEAYTTYMWGYFEQFIKLMDPEQMAHLMVRVFPQMVAAMPAVMPPMMKAMAKSAAGRKMLAAMMPVMFPMMAPGILKKVMPDLVAEVGQFIGEMPEDMAYLMPDLLPQTMDALMPTYIPQLIPPMVPLFVEYLKTA